MRWKDMQPGDAWWTGKKMSMQSAGWMLISITENPHDESDVYEGTMLTITYIELFGAHKGRMRNQCVHEDSPVPGQLMLIQREE